MRQIGAYSLWLGHVGDVQNVRSLFDAGIAAVVDLALNEKPATLPRELVYCRFPLIDGSGNPPRLLRLAVETLAHFIRLGIPTLVYCGMGMSRSPCVVGLALAKVRGCSAAEGLTLALGSAPADVSPALWRELQAAMSIEADSDSA